MTSPFGQLETLAEVGERLSEAGTLDQALAELARAAAAATGAALAVVRVPDGTGSLPARGVWAASAALAAELEGSRVPIEELGAQEPAEPAELPPTLRRLADRTGAVGVSVVPAISDGRVLASVELLRPADRTSVV
jgi:hypothetical protein